MIWMMFYLTLALDTGFDLESDSVETQQWLTFFQFERAEQTRDALLRSKVYVPRFKRYFGEEGVPEDLVWVAFVETSFRPAAVSPTGATGMYQFKTETARAMGLVVRRGRDDRNNPDKAARAAARYLAYLRNKFDSWELVLAAYNLGEGDLRRAMQARGVTSWLEIKPHVREETRNYVGKIKAAAVLGNRFLADVPTEASEPPRRYTVKKGDTLYSIAKQFEVDLDRLRRLNGITGNHIVPGRQLVIP